MIRLSSIVICMLLLTSCSPQMVKNWHCRHCPVTVVHTLEVRDSIIITEVIRDTVVTVYIPADSIVNVVRVVCDSAGLAQLAETIIKTNRMIVRLKVRNGVLEQNITTLMDSLTVEVQLRDKTIEHLKHTTSTTVATKPPEKRPFPWRWIAILTAVVLILVALNWLRRKIRLMM